MFEWEKILAARYALLRETRAGPVFFIEHGLAEAETVDLISDVRAAVEVHPLDSRWWDAHSLSLIATSTEAGYRYRGSGTDFWPMLAGEFGAEIGNTSRQRVRDLFSSAAKTYRGAHPPHTPWAEAFHLIAWPITHALIPREFHRSLALTLASLRANVADLDDVELCDAIRVAASTSSARFNTLLATPDLIVPITRSLLGAPPREICEETMQRIATDLSTDQLARRSITAARRMQQRATTIVSLLPPRAGVPAIHGRLHIRRTVGTFILEASFPPLDPQLSVHLRRALRSRRYAPRLWGVSARIPSEQLLSGLPFNLKLEATPPDNAPLFPGLDELSIDAELLNILGAFELRLQPPLVFAISADGQTARMIRGTEVSGYRKYWVLGTDHEHILGFIPSLGQVGPYNCREFDPQVPTEARALEELGLYVRFGVFASLTGSPPLIPSDSIPSFVVGDHLLVVPRRQHPDGLQVEFDGASAHVTDQYVRVTVPSGDGLVHVSSGGTASVLRFKGVSDPPTPNPSGCTISVTSSELTVQALLSGSLSFVIDSPAPLDGLEATIELEAGSRIFSVSIRLGVLPQTVSAKDELFAILLDDVTRHFLLQTSDATINARLGCLVARSWRLERRVRPCWWVREPNRIVLRSEQSDLEYGQVAATAPYSEPTRNEPASESEARLLVPLGLDASEYGPAARFTTLCLGPKQVTLAAPAILKPRLGRCRHAENGAVGLEDLLGAYLRWSLAESENLIAEFRRRQVSNLLDSWIAELCCGEEWARREASAAILSPWESLVARCGDNGLGLDSYVELSKKDEHQLILRAIFKIRVALPELWARVGPPYDLGDEDYDILENAFNRAYEDLANEYRDRGRLDLAEIIQEGDASADTSADRWKAELCRIQAEVEFHRLAELLLPTDLVGGLLVLDVSVMSLDELSDEFTRWLSAARRSLSGGMPEAEALRAVLAIWSAPEVAVGLNWRSAIDVLLIERPVARAARYLAIKGRQAKHGGLRWKGTHM